MGRTGLFGGTFDPPHIGHLLVAQEAAERLGLDRVLVVPVGEPPHKVERRLAPAESRVRMVEAALVGHDRLEVSRVEVDRAGPSYTVDTLSTLRESLPSEAFYLLIGADQLAAFGSWRSPGEVARLARIVVMARAGVAPATAAEGVEIQYETISVPRLDISSSEIRRRIGAGRSIRYWVPEPVLRIIEEEQLYTRSESRDEGTC